MMYFSYNERNADYAKDPGVVRFQGRYLLYYSIPAFPKDDPRNVCGWGIGIAESSDLKNWHYLGECPSLSPVENRGFCAPGARVIDGKVHLFYQSYDAVRRDAICHAVSTDGVNFVKDATNPIFAPPQCEWSFGRAIDADVIFFKGQWFLYAATRDPELKIQKLVVATAPAGSDFSAGSWQLAADRSILEPELPWEQSCIEAPATLIHNGKLYMFYGGAYNNAPQQIGCAVSSDGINFTRIADEPVLPCGKPGEWNSSESGHPFAFTDDDGTDYLFFQGNNDNGKTWHLSCKKIIWQGDIPQFVEF